MDKSSLIGLLVLTFAGGMLGSFGVSALLRSSGGRAFVVGWKWWGLALYTLAVLAVVAGVVTWAYKSVVQSGEPDGSLGSPWPLFLFGFAAGLPFTVLTAITLRYTAKKTEERSRKRRLKPATRRERLEFAKNLEGQLRDFADDLQAARVVVQGEEGTVIAVHANITRTQAEKLVHVLRGELQDLGFQRVESGADQTNWWVRV